jgi:NDP-sugar pyrophosphorylase family protein
MIALVLAAGFGTRFRPETLTRPKPLLPLGGRPILFHVFDHLLAQGADAFVVNAHHLAQELRGAIGESYAGVPVAWSVEEEILGTAGGIRHAHGRGLLGGGAFLVANADVFTTLPLGRLLAGRHREDVVSSLAVLPNGNPSVDTSLWADAEGRLVAVGGERPGEDATGPWLFTGLQAAKPALVTRIPAGFAELARHVLEPSVAARDGAFALVPYSRSDGLWFDLGTRERLAAAEVALATREAGVTSDTASD